MHTHSATCARVYCETLSIIVLDPYSEYVYDLHMPDRLYTGDKTECIKYHRVINHETTSVIEMAHFPAIKHIRCVLISIIITIIRINYNISDRPREANGSVDVFTLTVIHKVQWMSESKSQDDLNETRRSHAS